MMTWGALFEEAFRKAPDILVLQTEFCVYSVMLPDEGVTFEFRPERMLVLWWLAEKFGVRPINAAANAHRYRPSAMQVVAQALSCWDSLTADHKIWAFQRFRAHLEEAKQAATEYCRTQSLLAKSMEEKIGKPKQ